MPSGELSDLEARVIDLERRAEKDWAWLKRLEDWLGSLGQQLGLAARGSGSGRPAKGVALVGQTFIGSGGYPPEDNAAGPFAVGWFDGTIARSLTAGNIGVSWPDVGTWVLVSVLDDGSYVFQYDGGG